MWIAAPVLCKHLTIETRVPTYSVADYTNTMYSAYLPILSSSVFDNTGKPYDVSKILTKDFMFDQDAYKRYSRVFLPITYVLSYALQFAALTALLTHTAAWHGKDIWRQWRRSLHEAHGEVKSEYGPVSTSDEQENEPNNTYSPEPLRRTYSSGEPPLDNVMSVEDVHNRLMRRYEDVPVSWYLVTGAVMTAVGIFVVE